MDALMRAAGESSQDVFPMLDEHDGVVGTVSEQDVIRVLSPTERTFPLASRNLVRKEFVRDVEDVMTLHPSTVRSDQQTDAALRQMEALHLPQIVVDREGQANRYARNWRPKVIRCGPPSVAYRLPPGA